MTHAQHRILFRQFFCSQELFISVSIALNMKKFLTHKANVQYLQLTIRNDE